MLAAGVGIVCAHGEGCADTDQHTSAIAAHFPAILWPLRAAAAEAVHSSLQWAGQTAEGMLTPVPANHDFKMLPIVLASLLHINYSVAVLANVVKSPMHVSRSL